MVRTCWIRLLTWPRADWVQDGIPSPWLEDPTPHTDQKETGGKTRHKHLCNDWAHTQEEGQLDSRLPSSRMQASSLDFH